MRITPAGAVPWWRLAFTSFSAVESLNAAAGTTTNGTLITVPANTIRVVQLVGLFVENDALAGGTDRALMNVDIEADGTTAGPIFTYIARAVGAGAQRVSTVAFAAEVFLFAGDTIRPRLNNTGSAVSADGDFTLLARDIAAG